MISVKDQQSMFLLKWFKEIYIQNPENTTELKIVTFFFCRNLICLKYLTKATIKAKELAEVKSIHSNFWQDVIRNWLDWDKQGVGDENFEDINTIGNQPLFNNEESDIKTNHFG